MIAIINASPLIYLGKTGAISLLGKIFKECYTSEEVKIEVLRDINVPEYPVLKEFFLSKVIIKAPENQDLVRRLVELNIHYGEASIIALAKELQENYDKKVVIIDDLAARAIARTLGLRVTGTIGVFLKAMNQNYITSEECKNFLFTLVEKTTFRISAELLTKILKEIEKNK